MSKNLSCRVLQRQTGLITPLKFTNDICWQRTSDIDLSRHRDVVVVDQANVEDGSDEEERIPGNHSASVTSLDLEEQDGRYLLAGCSDGSLYIHDLANFRNEPRTSSRLVGHIKPTSAPPNPAPRSRAVPRPVVQTNRNRNGHYQGPIL
jgi:WD40 repeat protein